MAKATIRLPAYVSRVRLASGEHAYYWKLPSWASPTKDKRTGRLVPAVRHGKPCPVASSPLGTDHNAAIEKGEALSEAFAQWRKGIEATTLRPGSVAWLFRWYRGEERYTKNAANTQRDYLRLMNMLCEFPTKAGPFGRRMATLMDGPAADALYRKLRDAKGEREAAYAMQVCRLVWKWAARHKRVTGVKDVPFAGMGIKSTASKGNRATSRAEYDAYRTQAHAMGHHSMAAAAALCFETCQRTSEVFGFQDERDVEQPGLQWSCWQPGVAITLVQNKTGNDVALELSIDVDGEALSLYPELEAELHALAKTAPRDAGGALTGPIILDPRNGKRWNWRYMSTIHRKICDKAGLPKAMTFTGFRHGGITELGDAGTDDVRPIPGHKTLNQTRIYNKANAAKGRKIALARRAHIKKLGIEEAPA